MALHSVNVFADYHQFYVWDAGMDPNSCLDFTNEDCRRMVKTAPNLIVIQPVRNMDVPVDLEVCEADPGYDVSAWDHVAEAAVELPTGRLQVHECTGSSVLDLAVAPGWYRARALFAGLGTISKDGLDGDDRYKIVLWPGPPCALKIVKQWAG